METGENRLGNDYIIHFPNKNDVNAPPRHFLLPEKLTSRDFHKHVKRKTRYRKLRTGAQL